MNWLKERATKNLSLIQVLSLIVVMCVLTFVTNIAVVRGHSSPQSKAAAVTTLGGAVIAFCGVALSSNPVTLTGMGVAILGAAFWVGAEFDDGEDKEQPPAESRESTRQLIHHIRIQHPFLTLHPKSRFCI